MCWYYHVSMVLGATGVCYLSLMTSMFQEVEKGDCNICNLDSGKMVLELDVSNSTTYRYSMPNAGNIGIVSFKNMPADSENGSTVTVLFTQNWVWFYWCW